MQSSYTEEELALLWRRVLHFVGKERETGSVRFDGKKAKRTSPTTPRPPRPTKERCLGTRQKEERKDGRLNSFTTFRILMLLLTRSDNDDDDDMITK